MQKISLKDYLFKKEERRHTQKSYALKCEQCKKTLKTCYCSKLKVFEPETKFIILIHQEEVRRSVATGRMAHLSLKGSVLLRGSNFTEHEGLNEVLQNSNYHCVLLYPGKKAIPLSQINTHVPSSKKLVFILLDATWHEARRMYRFSTNLHSMPMAFFTPTIPSQFQVRKQPSSSCYSTIEAVHHVLCHLEPTQKFDGLLDPFHHMVQSQIHFEQTGPGRLP